MSDLLHMTSPEKRFAAMAELRAGCPVSQLGEDGPVYVASRVGCLDALPAIEHFTGGVGAGTDDPEQQTLNGMDEPRHGHVRRVVNTLIASYRAKEVEPFLTELCVDLCAQMASANGEPVDVMTAYADLVPSSAICWLMGWPVQDAAQLYRWTYEVTQRAMEMRPGIGTTLGDLHPEYAAYVDERVETRLATDPEQWPDDGLTRLLTEPVEDGKPLTPLGVRTQVMFLLGAGSETSRNMIGGLLWSLIRDPELYRRVRKDRSLVPNAVEESLRIYSPTQFMVRNCVEPLELDGYQVDVGDQVFIGLASANRDETVFDHPDDFDVDRANARQHLSFGLGPHICPGAYLVRLEGRVAANAFLDAFEDPRLESEELEPLPNAMFYGPARLLARLG